LLTAFLFLDIEDFDCALLVGAIIIDQDYNRFLHLVGIRDFIIEYNLILSRGEIDLNSLIPVVALELKNTIFILNNFCSVINGWNRLQILAFTLVLNWLLTLIATIATFKTIKLDIVFPVGKPDFFKSSCFIN
jgi:hypothetical protein